MKYRIDKGQQLVLCQPETDFSFSELLEHLNTLMGDRDFYPGINGLYDFTQVSHVTGDIQSLLSTADQINDKEVLDTTAHVAIVLANDDEHMHRIFEGYCLMVSDANVKYQLFYKRDYESALAFINADKMPTFNV